MYITKRSVIATYLIENAIFLVGQRIVYIFAVSRVVNTPLFPATKEGCYVRRSAFHPSVSDGRDSSTDELPKMTGANQFFLARMPKRFKRVMRTLYTEVVFKVFHCC